MRILVKMKYAMILKFFAITAVSTYAVCAFAATPSPQTVTYETGKEFYKAKCLFCHGAEGQGVGIFPALSVISRAEAEEKLLRYRASKKVGRYSSMMYIRASKLSDKDIKNLADYIGVLSGK